MGNVNVRGSEEEAEEASANGNAMPHSPPTVSPFVFTPQLPEVPLQTPEEMHVPSYSSVEITSGYEDMFNELGIPTMITWSYGGKEVSAEGSWDNWKTRMPLQRSGKDFAIMKVLPSGVYQYRFIVDGLRRYTPDSPWARDDAGDAYNILDLQCSGFGLHITLRLSSPWRIMFLKILEAFPVLSLLNHQSRAMITYSLVPKIMLRSHRWFLHSCK